MGQVPESHKCQSRELGLVAGALEKGLKQGWDMVRLIFKDEGNTESGDPELWGDLRTGGSNSGAVGTKEGHLGLV